MWDIDFITKENFKKHVKETIEAYGEKLQPYDLEKFNKNIIDPIKMIFDRNVYGVTWEEIINNEIFRQRDKAANNDIGYFNQKIFQYLKNCEVPNQGWDVIYSDKKGIEILENNKVSKIYVEMKNKHNTMNSAAAGKTFIKMQNQLLNDDDCACFLVEVISKKSQNVKWETTVDKNKVGHKLIRKVSIDKFLEIVTGDKDAFYKICIKLPEIIEEVINEQKKELVPKDTVIEELKGKIENKQENNNRIMEMAFYILGFETYEGFKK